MDILLLFKAKCIGGVAASIPVPERTIKQNRAESPKKPLVYTFMHFDFPYICVVHMFKVFKIKYTSTFVLTNISKS